MPIRNDIKSVLIIGAGPIVIGQACEFDYSGAQACKALKEEGIRVILINSNPATIMTDPKMADATYIEPIHWTAVEKIIEKEKPDALLPTMGGQTALNCALDLDREGILAKHNVAMIGASRAAIDMAEDRDKFRSAMDAIGLATPKAFIAHSLEEAWQGQAQIGFPIIIRPSFTMGGSGGGIAYNRDEFENIIQHGLALSPTTEVLIEVSVLGWKEYEMEVVRDRNDNCIIICSIENFDPMGVHTGDSITVAPAQTLSDKEYQIMRNASLAVLRKIGVETGGSNVQFAINPKNGEMNIIEMNPRVSRSSALASKATGFPIAKVAAKLAIGYTLDELQNDITGGATPASFEPSMDYVVTKIPRFTFEKFPQADDRLSTQMKSVGEVMAIGRTFQESFQKALRGLETGVFGLDEIVDQKQSKDVLENLYRTELRLPGAQRLWYLADAFRSGFSLKQLSEQTSIDAWFLVQIEDIIKDENALKLQSLHAINAEQLLKLKRKGFADQRLARLLNVDETEFAAYRRGLNIRPVYKRIDTCAGEFASPTAYLYSTYEQHCEADTSNKEKIIVLGGGPNRIGQGIEFDYCCVHAVLAMREDGYETIMINCNPETVSTDYDTSDRLYFEPLTFEDVMEVIDLEKPKGVIVQFGGQTPLNLATRLEAAGIPIIGTSPDSIDLAEDRERFQQLVDDLGLKQPPNRIVFNKKEAAALADEVGFPLVVRPSYVLGGRAMEIVYKQDDLANYMATTVMDISHDSPLLLDRFLDDAIEVDVDAVSDGEDVVIGGLMEHIEQAGIHSGDSACSLPPYTLSADIQKRICNQVIEMAKKMNVVGLMNAQFAIQGDNIYILEVNPRAARTVPFVSKATGVPIAKVATRCMVGQSLQQQQFTQQVVPNFYSVKESVFPFAKFLGVDPILGPEMKSTGEVMGVGKTFHEAFYKAVFAAGTKLPTSGKAFISVRDNDKHGIVALAKQLISQGFTIVGTRGTKATLANENIDCEQVNKVKEGRPHIVDMIKNKQISLIVNTTEGRAATADSFEIRREALMQSITYTTTMAGGRAMAQAIEHTALKNVYRLQTLHKEGVL